MTAEQAMQAMQANLSARTARIGELTSDAFAQEYPELCQYYKDMASMSYQMLFQRDELHDFWSGPVMNDGRIVQDVRIKWYGCPLRADIATLAIHMCSKTEMDMTRARSLCMRFNSTGCCAGAWGCDFLHLCLCCGSTKHGFSSCERSRYLAEEAQKFQRIFGLDPLDPSSKWAGNSLETVLLKLVGSEYEEELQNASAEGLGSEGLSFRHVNSAGSHTV